LPSNSPASGSMSSIRSSFQFRFIVVQKVKWVVYESQRSYSAASWQRWNKQKTANGRLCLGMFGFLKRLDLIRSICQKPEKWKYHEIHRISSKDLQRFRLFMRV
jgi:hypothetical protein